MPRVGSAVIVTSGSLVLLGRRAQAPNKGRWVLPGGRIEPFETIDAAGVREVAEETGLVVEITRRIGVFEVIDAPSEHRLIVYSEARPIGGQLRSSPELTDVGFFDRRDLPTLDLTPVVRSALEASGWLARRPRAVPG